MTTIMNATLNAILNTDITAKRKNSEGKYEQYTTTMLDDNFKHVPKTNAANLTDEGKQAISALEKTFEYMERAATATTDNQRNKCVDKAYEYARTYLKAVGMNTGSGNVSMLTSVFAPKKQTTKGAVKGGYTTKSTFIKYALYLSYNFATTGQWCAPKTSASKSNTTAKAFDYDQYAATLISFGMEETIVAKMVQALKAQAAA